MRNAGLLLSTFLALALVADAHAVVVRGQVRDPLGKPLTGARVLLIQGKRSIGVDVTGSEGSYEIRAAVSGRFVLLTIAPPFAPQLSRPFYGRRVSVKAQIITLDRGSVTELANTLQSGIRTPIEQAVSAAEFVPGDALMTRLSIFDDVDPGVGVGLVRMGQAGGESSLLMRGGAGIKVLVDGVSVQRPGEPLNLDTLPSTALDGTELFLGANSALYGSDAEAGVVSTVSMQGASVKPLLNYSGDAGNLHTWRNEVAVSGTHGPLDYLGAYSRFDTSNAVPLDRFHASNSDANLGYALLTNTFARFTLHNTDSASGIPGPHDILGISTNGRHAEQDLYSGIAVENDIAGVHTVARYGILRSREQRFAYAPVGTAFVAAGVAGYLGLPVTLRGANGYQVTGQAIANYPGSYPAREDDVANRDQLSIRSSYESGHHFTVLGGFEYRHERGEYGNTSTGQNQHPAWTDWDYTLQVQGDIVHRVFYSVGGLAELNQIVGLKGSPRVGVGYVPVRSGKRIFRGTKIYANAATGLSEPGVREQATSLAALLARNGQQATVTQLNLAANRAHQSRTSEIGVDQNILAQKLILHVDYFHNQFSHQMETLDPGTLRVLYGVPVQPLSPGAADNSLAFRAQGVEAELRYQPFSRIFVHGSYTYLSSVVEQAFAAGGLTNPSLPSVLIGPAYPLLGARPFRRPPHTGTLGAQYTGTSVSAAVEASLASRSDDSTFQAGADRLGGNTLLLPNRDLDFGYVHLNASVTWTLTRHLTVFSQLENLLNQQHTGAIGYPGLPLTARGGLKIRFGGE